MLQAQLFAVVCCVNVLMIVQTLYLWVISTPVLLLFMLLLRDEEGSLLQVYICVCSVATKRSTPSPHIIVYACPDTSLLHVGHAVGAFV